MRDHNFTGESWLKWQKKATEKGQRLKRYVFLDVDGVINSSRSVMARTGPIRDKEQEHNYNQLVSAFHDPEDPTKLAYLAQYTVDTVDPVAVALVNRLIKKGNCRLVLSSSHRYSHRVCDQQPHRYFEYEFGNESHRTALKWYLNGMGIKLPDGHAIHVTPDLHCERGEEVDMYIENVLRDDDKYVILDDGRDFKRHQNLVWCDPKVGFSHANYLEACTHLEIEESPLLY